MEGLEIFWVFMPEQFLQLQCCKAHGISADAASHYMWTSFFGIQEVKNYNHCKSLHLGRNLRFGQKGKQAVLVAGVVQQERLRLVL